MTGKEIITAAVRLASGIVKVVRGVRTAIQGLGTILEVFDHRHLSGY